MYLTKFCPKCGEENEDVAQFCSNYGHDFKDVNQRMKESKRENSSFPLSGTKILLCIVLLIVLIIAAFLFTGGNADKPQNITMIKENTYGFTFVNRGVLFYNYHLDEVLPICRMISRAMTLRQDSTMQMTHWLRSIMITI
ncbi:hypothetical protein mru_1653 [Methanobrevibacter ruminantium M1]|uniref:Zinc-ribbon domain-containing protein n=1 Tax=Methanobrevibacter ruminantium (strain ATCC 35063 / DSM 1093 / JCM 13430 / OCM 146 / M1) TaxID=634498 RepID=D3E4V9_METRM|nr:hypothetical protein mru_1653 [Methanobrevibacter ruminantium M1]